MRKTHESGLTPYGMIWGNRVAFPTDIGIAGGRKFGFLFKKGRKIRKIKENRIVNELMAEIRRLY